MLLNPHATRDALDRKTGYTDADEAAYRRPVDRAQLFRTAWRNARFDAAMHGLPLRAAFAKALREAWAAIKAMGARLVRPALAAATDELVASIRAAKADGKRLFDGKPWRFANVLWR